MIGIIGAMEEEVAALKEDMDIQETVEQASMVFCKGKLCGKDVVVVRSGIGKVNAGICAQVPGRYADQYRNRRISGCEN